MNLTIHLSTDPHELPTIRALFEEYAGSLGIDLEFQQFDRELAELPGPCASPSGCILLALADGQPAGCVALKPLAAGICEMKRLYSWSYGYRKPARPVVVRTVRSAPD